MENTFVILKSIDSRKEIFFESKWISKCPKRLYYFYAIRHLDLFCKEFFIDEIKGYEMYIPILKEDILKNNTKIQIMIEKLNSYLYEKNIIILNTEYESLFQNFLQSSNKNIHCFFLMQWIEYILKFLNLDLKNTSVVIIDGNNKETELAIDVIYSHVNYLSIYTLRASYFNKKIEEIFEDVGLNVEINNNLKKIAKKADIIIKLKKDKIDLSFLKTNAILIDLSNDKENIKRYKEQRRDIFIVNNAEYIYNQKIYKSEMIDIYLYIKEKMYQNYVHSAEYNFDICRMIFDFLQKEIKMSELFFLGESIISKKI